MGLLPGSPAGGWAIDLKQLPGGASLEHESL